jgi:putative DNA primase/helicase
MASSGYEAVPAELKNRPQWVCWRWAQRDGKYTKPPVDPHSGGDGSSTDPRTWATFDGARAHCDRAKLAGVGFVVRRQDRITGGDLDKCRDPETGIVEPWALEIVQELKSYTEVTPSGTGLRIWVRGNLPGHRRRKGHIEFYDDARYLTVTGQHLEGTPTTIEDRQAELDALYARIFDAKQPDEKGNGHRSPEPLDLADQEIIKRASAAKNGSKFSRLWAGQWKGDYASQSEADLGLAMMLAFWTGRDASRVDALFRQSGLFREKWNSHRGESTYGRWTVTEACRRQTETYSPRSEPRPVESEPPHDRQTTDNPRPDWKLWDTALMSTWPDEPLVWSVENLIPRGGIGFVSAAPKDRKSLITLDLGLHLAQPVGSRRWLDKYACTPATVLYIAREDHARRIKERALEICRSYQMPLPDPGRLQFLIRERISLTDIFHLEWLKAQIVSRGFDFLILDVLNRMIPDLDELSAKDMAKLVSILEELNRELGVTILCDDHTRKPQGKNIGRDTQEPNPFDLKGSVAKYGCADFMICLSRTPQDSRMLVYVENKDTDERPMFFVEVSPKGSADPKFRFGGSVEKLAGDMRQLGETNRNKILQAIQGWMSRDEIESAVDLSKSTIAGHLKALFDAGLIEKTGKGHSTRYRKPSVRDEETLWTE